MGIADQYAAANKPDQVLFVIMTDGEENSSREFDRQHIMAMIEDRQKTAGYEFLYLGANQDAYQVGSGIGIHGGRSLDYAASPAGALRVMNRVSWNVTAHRRTGGSRQKDGEFFSAQFESLGKMSREEYEAERDRAAGCDCEPGRDGEPLPGATGDDRKGR
jgi:hypothetical protein